MNDQVSTEVRVRQMVVVLQWLGVIVLVSALGVAGWFWWKARSTEQAKAAFDALFVVDQLEEVALRESTALNKGVQEVLRSWSDEKKNELRAKLSAVAADHPKTTPATLALLRLGRFEFDEGRLSEAATAFEKAVQSASGGDQETLKAMALEGAGVVAEAQKQWDSAMEFYSQGEALAKNPLSVLVSFGKARVLLEQGKVSEAHAVYDSIVQKHPNSDFERKARALKAMPAPNAKEGGA